MWLKTAGLAIPGTVVKMLQITGPLSALCSCHINENLLQFLSRLNLQKMSFKMNKQTGQNTSSCHEKSVISFTVLSVDT